LRFRYRTLEIGTTDIHVRTLRDVQQFSDPEGAAESLGVSPATWPLFGVIWESSEILARLMATFDIDHKRILEVGCGIGLASLLLNSRFADITATDQHPDADSFLAWNVGLNHGAAIPFIRTGWEDAESELGTYDLIIGSDVLYQPNHPAILSGFIVRHARPACQVIVTDPGRGHGRRFSKEMVHHGFVQQDLPVAEFQEQGHTFHGHIRSYIRNDVH
jgi:predicted nicotinamide N-methyase